MQDAPTIIARKLANALIPGAQPTVFARTMSSNVLGFFSRIHGGLWLGGTITLTPRELSFRPNGMNRALHTNASDITVPLERVVEVTDRFGILTRIVDVKSDDGSVLTFRCFGAPALAQKIEDAVKAAR